MHRRNPDEPAEHGLSMKPSVADVLLAAVCEWWTKLGSILKHTSWTTEDAVTLRAGRPAAEKEGELGVSMPSGFPENLEQPPPQI